MEPTEMGLKRNIRVIEFGIKNNDSDTNPSIRSYFPLLKRVDIEPYVLPVLLHNSDSENALIESFGDIKHIREVCHAGKWWKRWTFGRD